MGALWTLARRQPISLRALFRLRGLRVNQHARGSREGREGTKNAKSFPCNLTSQRQPRHYDVILNGR